MSATLLGYLGSPCPHDPTITHMGPVLFTSSATVHAAEMNCGWPADTSVCLCPACLSAEAGTAPGGDETDRARTEATP